MQSIPFLNEDALSATLERQKREVDRNAEVRLAAQAETARRLEAALDPRIDGSAFDSEVLRGGEEGANS